jgi:hypothetical protein
MLIQHRIIDPDSLLKLVVAIDSGLKALQPHGFVRYVVGATTLFTEFSTKRGPQHHLQCWFNSHRLYSERKRRTGSGIS